MWFRDGLSNMPKELSELINIHSNTRGFELDYVIPECETKTNLMTIKAEGATMI